MALLFWLDRVAHMVRPETVTAGWVVVVVVAVLVCGARRRGRSFRSGIVLGAYLIGASLAIAVAHLAGAPPVLVLGLALLAVVAFGWWLVRGQAWTDALPEVPLLSARRSRAGLGLIVVLAASCLAIRFTTYSGTMMTWEPSVVEGLQTSFRNGTSVPS
jgi:hypothetical protein